MVSLIVWIVADIGVVVVMRLAVVVVAGRTIDHLAVLLTVFVLVVFVEKIIASSQSSSASSYLTELPLMRSSAVDTL